MIPFHINQRGKIMKRNLFLLPLLACGLLFAGCDEEGGGAGGVSLGDSLPVEFIGASATQVSMSADEAVLSHNGVSFKVEKNTATNDVGGEGQAFLPGTNRQMRIYGGQKVTITYGTAFSKIVFDIANYDDNPYAQWFTSIVNGGGYGTAVQGTTNKSEVVVSLDSAATSWSYVQDKPEGEGWKQNRIYSFKLQA